MMKKICPNLKNKEVAKEFGELQDIFGEEMAHLLWSRNNGYSIDKAPNGAESILFGDLLELAEGDRTQALILKAKVYSDEFFNWFGDWTSEDKTNVSKVVDENGEPKAVYHTVSERYDPSFKKFDTRIEGRETAIYHTDNLRMSSTYNVKSYASYENYTAPYNDDKYSWQRKIQSLLNTAKEYASFEEDKHFVHEMLEKLESGELGSIDYDFMYASPYDYILSTLEAISLSVEKQDKQLLSFKQKIKDARLSLFNNPAINKTEHDLKNALKNVKVDYLCIKNPKVFDAEGRSWKAVITTGKPVSEGIEEGVDGVIINNVKDYGIHLDYETPHTVYEAIDNSQVKSIYNNGEFANPDDMYASLDDRANHMATIRIGRPYLADPTKPYLKAGLSADDRLKLVAQLRQYDPQLSIKCNPDGKWYITRSKSKVKAFAKQLDPDGLISKDKVLLYLTGALKGHRELVLVNAILKQSSGGVWNAIKFKIGRLEPGVAAQFNPADHSITIATGAMVKFRNNSNLKDYVAQTILHELVHYFTYEALHNSSQLRQKAEELRHYIIDALGDKANEYGLTDIYEMLAELTNVDFVNKLKSIKMPERKFSAVLKKVKDFLRFTFGQVFNYKEKGTAYEHVVELLVEASDPKKFAVPYNVKDNHTAPMKSITAAQEEVDRIHLTITAMYQELYKGYKKQLNKSANKVKREDAIWTTILDLRAKDKKLTLEISMMSALELIGVYETDTTGAAVMAPPTTILGFLQQELATNKLTNLTAGQILDMKTNIIDFYNNLSREVNDIENSNMDPQDNELRIKLQNTVGEISRLWKIAANNVADRLVDENVDKYISASELEKQDIKIVAKNWLHRNDMWGDEAKFTAFFNYSRNNSPIIRQAFQIILDADAKTREESLKVYTKLAKAFKAASSMVDNATAGNWLTEFMERYTHGPKKGLFTGLFKSAINYGQFKYDQEEFIKDLNKRFDDKYGYHYVTDKVTGEPYRSDTGASIEDEEWVNGVEPPYVEYLREKEQWLCDHAERRYTSKYYLERLSEPYSSTNTKGHGLSPKTMQRMDYITGNITHIMQLCSENGVAYPERLSDDDYKKLLVWRDALADLGNIFDSEGNLKEGEALQMAQEIQAWNDFKNQQATRSIDYAEFDKACNDILNEVKAGKRPYSDYVRFIDINSEFGIDTRLFDKVFKGNKAVKYYMSRIMQNSMKGLVKTKNAFVKDFHGVLWRANPDGTIQPSDMFAIAKLADAKNEEFKELLGLKSGIDPVLFEQNFTVTKAPYYDDNGMLLSADGTHTIDPRNPGSEKYMTWFDYIINQYVDAVMDGRMKTAIGYDDIGKPVVADFSTFTSHNDVYNWFYNNMFTHKVVIHNKKTGAREVVREPSTIFYIMVPNNSSYIRYIPKGRFAHNTSNSAYSNNAYSEENKNGVQPKFDIYGDSTITDMLNKGGKKAEYYKLLLDTMDECWKMLGVDDTYNRFKLPQIEAPTSQKLSRGLRDTKGTVKNIVHNIANATSDDLDMRNDDDFVLRNGRWVLSSAPMRFINELEDPNMIDSDLASTVGRFAEMAINFKNKSKAQGKLEVLGYALDDENREAQFRGRGHRLKERYDKMMKQLFYESKSTSENVYDKPDKTEIAASKALGGVRTATAYLMLAYNLPSMATGLWDAVTQLPSHAARGERFGFKDLAKAFACNPAAIIRAIMNIGNPIPNCKLIAMMLKDGLVITTKESYHKQYRNRLVKALSLSATGGYTCGDYMVNLLIQRAAYNAKKYYPGEPKYGIPEGFYTKELFEALMDGKADKKTIKAEFLRGNNLNMWDAYVFDGRTVKVKPGYELAIANTNKGQMSANIQLLAALINGNNAKNDQASISQNVVFKCFSLMRNYFFRRMEHWIAGYRPDNVVKALKEVIRDEVRGGKTLRTKTTVWENTTNEQKSRRAMYDYSSGVANPAVLVNLGRIALSSLRVINQHIFTRSKLKTDKRAINKQEAKAAKEFTMWLLCLAALSVGWMAFHRYVEDETGDKKPEDYEHSLPSLSNFVELKNYLKLIDQVGFRVIDSQLQLFNPYQLVDIVKSATVITNAVDKWAALANWLTSGDASAEITSDSKYKYFTKRQRWVWSALPLGNIQTWSSWRGNEKVGRWYFDNTITGNLFKAGGYKWKTEQEKESKEAEDSLTPDVNQYLPDTESSIPDANQYLPEGY